MTPSQLQMAVSQCVQQALKSGQTPPVAVFGILECVKLDLHASLVEMQKQQESAIVPAKIMPDPK